MKEILRVDGLSLRQNGGTGPELLVDDVHLRLSTNRTLTLIGESGCGKSLVGQAVIGLIPEGVSAEGGIFYKGQNILSCGKAMRRLWGRELFLFPQEPGKYLNPLARSLPQVAEVYQRVHNKTRNVAYKYARRMMKEVDLGSADERKYPWQLSGGMGQRLLTAISIAEPARVVVADEPTKGLDRDMKLNTAALLKSLADSGKALLVITHDLEIAEFLGGDLAVMYGGRIVETGATDEVLQNPRHPYSSALRKSLPKNGLDPVPRRANGYPCYEDGCVFLQRCVSASPKCFKRPVLQRDKNEGRLIACHLVHNDKGI